MTTVNHLWKDIMLKFPNLAEEILKELENESVANCRKISKPWRSFIDNQKFLWIRKMSMYKRYMIKFKNQWNKVIRRTPVGNVKELSIAVQEFFDSQQNNQNGTMTEKLFDLIRKQTSPLHVAAQYGNFQLFTNIFEKKGCENPATNNNGYTPLHLAAQFGHSPVAHLILGN